MKWHATSMLRVCNFTPGVLSGYQFYVLKGFSQAQGGMLGAAPPPPRYVLNQLPPPPGPHTHTQIQAKLEISEVLQKKSFTQTLATRND